MGLSTHRWRVKGPWGRGLGYDGSNMASGRRSSEGMEVIRTPFRAAQANGVAERFVRTVRSECLDWLLFLNQQHLERALAVFVDHYNGDRPHRALDLTPPCPTRSAVAPAATSGEARLQRCDRLGGLVHEYILAA